MKKELKLIDRKYTTEAGLRKLEELINSFDGEFLDDVDTVVSKDFYMRIEVDNDLSISDVDYKSWENIVGFWKIHSGSLVLVSEDKDQEVEWDKEGFDIMEIKQINFKDCLENLALVISLYNDKCEEKESQISDFMDFCEKYFKKTF